jgi:hypothetical protein
VIIKTFKPVRNGLPDVSAEYDGSIIFSPGFVFLEHLEAAGEIVEGKAIGTAREMDLILAKDFSQIKGADPKEFAHERKVGQTVGRRALKQAQNEARADLLGLIGDYHAGKLNAKEFKKQAGKKMKKAWKRVYLAGIRAGGTTGRGQGRGAKPLVDLHPTHDTKFMKGAMTHEMRFLNKFVEAVVDETWKMPLERRVEMYVDALTSFYENARVISLPLTSVIYWTGPDDKKTCPSCEYLFENNPYTKLTLPTVPRSGATICLTNCRDRLFVRRESPEKAEKVTRDDTRSSKTHVRNLRKIKRLGHK